MTYKLANGWFLVPILIMVPAVIGTGVAFLVSHTGIECSSPLRFPALAPLIPTLPKLVALIMGYFYVIAFYVGIGTGACFLFLAALGRRRFLFPGCIALGTSAALFLLSAIQLAYSFCNFSGYVTG